MERKIISAMIALWGISICEAKSIEDPLTAYQALNNPSLRKILDDFYRVNPEITQNMHELTDKDIIGYSNLIMESIEDAYRRHSSSTSTFRGKYHQESLEKMMAEDRETAKVKWLKDTSDIAKFTPPTQWAEIPPPSDTQTLWESEVHQRQLSNKDVFGDFEKRLNDLKEDDAYGKRDLQNAIGAMVDDERIHQQYVFENFLKRLSEQDESNLWRKVRELVGLKDISLDHLRALLNYYKLIVKYNQSLFSRVVELSPCPMGREPVTPLGWLGSDNKPLDGNAIEGRPRE